MLLLLWFFISRQRLTEHHRQNVVLKLQAQMGWVSRKKKGLYFVYFKHYKHPKGEKVQEEKFGFIWYVPIQYLYFKHYVLPQRQYMYLRQIIKKNLKDLIEWCPNV